MNSERTLVTAPGTVRLSTESLEQRERLAQLQPEWEALLARYPGANPFLTFAWAWAWLATIGRDFRPLVIVVRDGRRVCAIAPLCVHPGGQLTFIGYPQNDYADIIVDPEFPGALDAVVAALYAKPRAWKRAVLDGMREERSQAGALARALRDSGRLHRMEESDPCPAMILQDRAAAKKQYHKKNIANYVNWFKARGDLRFQIHDDEVLAPARLEDLFAQHIARWSGTSTPSSFQRPEVKEFYRAFVRAMRPQGWVKLAVLSLGDELLALYLFFEFDRVIYLYKPTFNPAYQKHSPGQVILRYLFDHAVEHDIGELDLTRGDEAYKSRFANVTRTTHRVHLYDSLLAQRWAALRHGLIHSGAVQGVLRTLQFRVGASRLLRSYRRRRASR